MSDTPGVAVAAKYEPKFGGECLFEKLFEACPEGILVVNASGSMVRVNERAERMFGYTREEMLGRPIETLIPERFRENHGVALRNYMAILGAQPGSVSLETEGKRRDGTEFPAEIVVSPVMDAAEGLLMLAAVRDITERKRTEEALRDREQQLQTIMDNTTTVIYVKDTEGRYLQINRQFEKNFGVSKEHVIGRTAEEILPPEIAARSRADDRKVIQTRSAMMFEHELPQKDGLHTYIVMKFPLLGATGVPYAVGGVATDITDRKRAEAEREKLLSILEATPDFVAMSDASGNATYINRGGRRLAGLADDEDISGMKIPDFHPQWGGDLILNEAIPKAVRDGVWRGENALLNRDGRQIPVSQVIVAHKAPDGKVVQFSTIARDITERKRAEAENEKLLSILEATPDFVAMSDASGNSTYLNRGGRRLAGLADDEDISGMKVSDFHPQWGADLIFNEARPKAVRDGVWEGENALLNRDGRSIPVSQVVLAQKSPDGKVVQFSTIARDITERKRAEEALRDREHLLQSILDNSPATIYIKDMEGRYLKVNRYCAETLGASEQRIIGKTLHDFFPAELSDRIRANEIKVIESRAAMQFEDLIPRQDGVHTCLAIKFPLLDSSGEPYAVCCISTDITERKRAENALREREQLLESILDNSTAVIYLKDRDGRLLRVNRQFEELFGVKREQILGKTDYDLFPKDMVDRWRANDEKVLETGTAMEFEEVVPQSDGLHTYISIKFPIYGSSGIPFAVGGISTDITERKKTEAALLLEVTNVLVSNLEVGKLFDAISASIRQVVAHDFASLALYDPESGNLRIQRLTNPAGKDPAPSGLLLPIHQSPSGWVFTIREPVIMNRLDTSLFPPQVMQRAELLHRWIGLGVKSVCWLPLLHGGSALGVLLVASLEENAFPADKVRLLIQVANQVAVALDNAMAFRQIAGAMDRLAQEKLYLEDELKTEYNFEEIIGESAALKRVLKQVETVADTDATVLILGETGTGKELIARAIHNLSSRRDHTFVKLNCAAVPSGLLESELFGHEKGAFTGAIARRIGRLELAHGGTLLLDEIGDIPLELQPKLLRALQEKEIERVGGTRTIPVDVRLLAATNRDLAQMVREGRFRRDLFYRLSVFPLTLPALRERSQDIPLLVHYFLQKHAQRTGKPIKTIPPAVMEALVHWPWPGNVREMENVIERAVILSKGSELRIPLSELRTADDAPAPSGDSTLESVEREHILQVLRESKGVIGGPQGAASKLGLKRTTLNFKMGKLGITRDDIRP